MNTPRQPDPQFIESIVAGLAYWQEQTAQLDDQNISALDTQRQNLYRIVQYGLVLPQTWRDTAVVALQAFDLIEQRGYWQEWIPVLQQSIDRCAGENGYLKLKLLNRLGQLYRLVRQLPDAIKSHHEAQLLAEVLDNQQVIAEAHYNLAEDYLQNRDYRQAERHGQVALARFTGLPGTAVWQAATLNTLGMVSRACGDLYLAEQRLSEAVTLRRSLNHTIRLARALSDLATILQAAEKFERAKQCLMEAAAILAPTANELDKVMVQINLGSLYYQQRRWADAEVAYRQADSVYLRQSGHIFYQAMVAHNLGEVLFKQDTLEEAEIYLRHSMALWQQANDNLLLANTLGVLGTVLKTRKKKAEAIILYERAIALLKSYPDDPWARQLLENFAAQLATLTDWSNN